MKLIRECRMGPPKSFKTGAVVGTYPKPLLYFGFDRSGIDVIPPASYQAPPMDVKLDCTYEDIDFRKPGQMREALAQPPTKKITAFDYALAMPTELTLEYKPVPSQMAMAAFQAPQSGDYNVLVQSKTIPWKTIVFDSVTGYQDIILNHMASFNPGMMADARAWAGQCGAKVRQLILSATSLPCHVVFIFHTNPPESDDQTKLLLELPNVYSKLKGVVGGLFSQYFYTCRNGLKPVIKNLDYAYVKGLGSRWPAGLPSEVAPDFQSIYGKELL